MAVHPNPRNLVRQMLPKRQPRTKKSNGFSTIAKQDISHRSHGMCELDFCGPAEQFHHRAPRGRGGTSLEWVNGPANALHVASRCHERIERNRAEAYENGWLVRRNGSQTATEVPALYRGRWVLLDDRGGVTPIEGGAA
ncbi:hypothetical protein [Nocardia sp. NPDC019302]|uniref:hypothetical protein n=1 Tax=Nocardia sp. NPDC019302 TaxID=3154592 RepID=UPI0033E3B801